MKTFLITILTFALIGNATGQAGQKTSKEKLLAELAQNGCKCVDSIDVYDKSHEEVSKEVNKCIDQQTGAYQLGTKLFDIDLLKDTAVEKDGKKQINISFDINENSPEYKKYYYELERYMMENCKSLKSKVAAIDNQNQKSVSQNPEALQLYDKGLAEAKEGNYKKAIKQFEKAIKIDPEFAFAWDNLGLCHRKLGDYDKALEAYKKSLEIDPKGMMPLQNIAVVYQYQKNYTEAVKAYERMMEIDKNNPEIYYGIGQIYAVSMGDLEKGLDNMCKAYNLYIEQKSPYRTDAEKLIQLIYSEMKKKGKEEKFNEILKQNKITPQ